MSTNILTDEQLLARVRSHCAANARLLADLMTDLIDVEVRGIHLREASSSMYEFCRREFDMSPSQAWRRTTAARLVRRVPILLEYVRSGEIDLSTLVLLRNHIDEENAEELIRATRCRSKRQIQRYLESREPARGRGKRMKSGQRESASSVLERLEAIDEQLYVLEVAVRNETRILIDRARDLLSSAMPDTTLGDLVHRAFLTLVETLENAIAGARAKREAKRGPAKAGAIPRVVRHAVLVRDGFQCTFVSSKSVRCRATQYLEIDHIIPRAHGGTNDLENLRCACSAHNKHYANEVFGKEFIQSRIRPKTANVPLVASVSRAPPMQP